jgi:hypothetical protein
MRMYLTRDESVRLTVSEIDEVPGKEERPVVMNDDNARTRNTRFGGGFPTPHAASWSLMARMTAG